MSQRSLSPATWPSWLLIGLLWLLSRLPWAWQRALGAGLGLCVYHLPLRFRRIVLINLRLCLPNLQPSDIDRLARAHFMDLGISLFESAFTWWASEAQVAAISTVTGLEVLQQAAAAGNGVILTTYHSTTLSIGARIINHHIKLSPLYRPTKNRVIASISANSFKRLSQQAILHTDIRRMIQALQNANIVWYVADQNYRRKGAMNVPLFNIPAASNVFAPRLATMTNSVVVFYTCARNPSGHYDVQIYPALEWRDADPYEATLAYHHKIEQAITQHPSQYWWIHRRFKPLHPTDADPYHH